LLEKYCHIGTDQFREYISTGLSSVSYEVLSSSVPLVTHNSKITNYFRESPIIEALTENDILNVFIDYEKNSKKYQSIGEESGKWFNENLGLGLAKKYVKLIRLLVNDKTLTQNNKLVRDVFEN